MTMTRQQIWDHLGKGGEFQIFYKPRIRDDDAEGGYREGSGYWRVASRMDIFRLVEQDVVSNTFDVRPDFIPDDITTIDKKLTEMYQNAIGTDDQASVQAMAKMLQKHFGLFNTLTNSISNGR